MGQRPEGGGEGGLMTLQYEWCVEEIDKHGDVMELHFCESRADAQSYGQLPGDWVSLKVCLIRDRFDNKDGALMDRQYAYLDKRGILPATFDGGAAIPGRFRK